MAYGAPEVDSPQEDAPIAVPDIRRERVVVRRRRARGRHHKRGVWTARASRRKDGPRDTRLRGVLVLMALGLYFGLSRQEIRARGGLASSRESRPSTLLGQPLARPETPVAGRRLSAPGRSRSSRRSAAEG